ncbi:hypothetical protein [Leucobacter sp. G161]|uniref:hypothetical protein n=1 Tax=Leucobacter sp. G161 TaxID=663704 RepID=UPI00073B252C|nr:hypothetical protein [Leucobacter sp. G161]KUF07178.1 hypothetical protein AUL38_02505 [Leucobacter sp. G161]
MSEQTKAALDAALEAHIADECDGMLTAYILQAEYTSPHLMDDRSTGYFRAIGERQSFTTTLGLTRYLDETVTALTAGVIADE